MATTQKTIDSKGRLALGGRFANRAAIVEEREGEFIVKLARVIPERESWLYENKQALGAVRRGLDDAARGRVGRGPDLAKARALADRVPDSDE